MIDQSRPWVDIALATYNGQRFLGQQLESIKAQSWSNINIIASDDNSSDKTLVILRDIDCIPRTILRNNNSLGVKGNFSAALFKSTAEYVFLSDQDDWWEPHKVETMMERIVELEGVNGKNHPIMVYSDLDLVDEDLHKTGASWFKSTAKYSGSYNLPDLVLTGHVPGCAMAMNRALLDIALPIPDRAYIHDWWFTIVAAVYGTTSYVDQPLIRYRQHGGNTLGSATAISSPRTKLRRLLRSPLLGVRQQMAFYDDQAHVAYGNLEALRDRFGCNLPTSAIDLLYVFTHGGWRQRYQAVRAARSGASTIAEAAITWRMGSIR